MGTGTVAKWTGGMAFDIELQGHRITVDATAEAGGRDLGPSPKSLLLAGLAGCTGMDVVAILRKMGQEWDSFNLQIEAQTSEKHPKVYTDIRINYIFSGKNLSKDKIEKAVNLSQDQYCGVSAMLKGSASISYKIIIEE